MKRSRPDHDPRLRALSPCVFAPDAIDERTAAFNRELEAKLAAAPPVTDFEPAVIRAARESGATLWGPVLTVPEAEARRLSCPGGLEVPIRVIPAPTSRHRGIYLHIHGGGWMLGASHHSDVHNRAISRLGLTTVSVDYRLSPEHPYPAAPDDCEAVARWLLEGGAAELGGGPLTIGGESAGAHLSLVTLLRLRTRYQETGFAAANLFYGCYDIAMTPSARNWGERNLVLNTPIIRWFCDSFAGAHDLRDPDLSPLLGDLARLPRLLLSVGTLDPLLDDTLFLHSRYLAAGNRAELALYAGGIHAFNAFPIPLAREANARADRFLIETATDEA